MLFLHLYVVLRMYVPLLLIYQSHIYVFSIPFPNTQVDQTIVSIFIRMILDIMLDHVGIPRAIYRRRMYPHNTMTVTVLFYRRNARI
ncbi:hypothetical protein ACQJBY_007085 [Aegilops geniculata]